MGRPKGLPKTGGKPKGFKAPSTILKEDARIALRQIILREMESLVLPQMDACRGIRHFIARNPVTGEFKRLTSAKQIEAALNAPGAKEGSTFWIYTKDPSTMAFKELMDRALDKAKEQEQEVKLSGESDLIAALVAGRERALGRKK